MPTERLDAGGRLARRAALLTTVLAALLPLPAAATDAPLRVGVSSGLQTDAIHITAEKAEAEGLAVEIVEFTDWVTPNEALANGDIDVNYFQHIPFLENAKAERGYDFVPIALGTVQKLGLYSSKYKSFDEVQPGDTVAIANDPVNGGRGLILLERAGLLKLREGVGYKATTTDILENPKELEIVQLEASQLARALSDVDLAQGYPSFLRLAGIDPSTALLLDPVQPIYAIQWVVQPKDTENPRIRRFIEIYQQSPEVLEVLKKHFGEYIAAAW